MKRSRHHNLSWKLPLLFLCLALFSVAAIPSAHAVVFESGIPGVGMEGAAGADLPSLAKYVSFLYIFVLGMVGIAAFVSLVVWGTVWTATGIVDKKAMALESIKNTFIGIGIALTAYIVLNTINPALVSISAQPPESTNTTISSGATSGCGSLTKNRTEANKIACQMTAGCCWGKTLEDAANLVTVDSCIDIPCN